MYNAESRKTIIDIARTLGCKDIEYLNKNSNVTDDKVAMYIYHHHCLNATLQRMFKERIETETNIKIKL